MAGYLPRSEGELYRARPGSNRPGSFPPSALLGAEKIVYETRPTLIGMQPLLFWAGVPVLVFFGLIAVVGAFSLGSSGAAVATLVFVLLIAFAPLLVAVGRWRRSGYAITDQRVVTRTGDTFDSVPLVRVSTIRLGRKSSTLVFELTPDTADAHSGLFGHRPPVLEWKGVPGAPGVATYANSAVRFFQMQQRQKQLRDAAVSTRLEDRVVCEYCGAMIPVNTLAPDNPRCPRCSAPILVAPLGI